MSGYDIKHYDALGVNLKGNSQGSLSVSGSAAQTSAIAVSGMYDVWCDIDVYLKVGPVANDVTTSSGYLLRANTTIPIKLDDGDRIGGISGGSGTLRFHKVS